MINQIKIHNYLNGLTFSFIEFLVGAVVAALFAAGDLKNVRIAWAVVSIGWVFNWLTVSGFALRSLLRREEDMGGVGIVKICLNREIREKVKARYPSLSLDTAILTLGCLVPFSVAILSLYERMVRVNR